MKKTATALLIVVSAFTFGYLQSNPKGTSSPVLAPPSRSPVENQKNEGDEPSPSAAKKDAVTLTKAKTSQAAATGSYDGSSLHLKEALAQASGPQLYQKLFDDPRTKTEILKRMYLVEIERRFKRAYPESSSEIKHNDLKGREAMDRIGILKALYLAHQKQRNAQANEWLKVFYKNVLLNEQNNQDPWLVKRQALRNLTLIHQDMDENERMALYSRLDSRLMSTASLSDRELIEVILEK